MSSQAEKRGRKRLGKQKRSIGWSKKKMFQEAAAIFEWERDVAGAGSFWTG